MNAYLEIFELHRPLLLSIAYRMLRSRADAEDMVQDAFLRCLRWQRATEAEIRNPKAFLITIVTRLSINRLHARAKREQYFGQWLPEPLINGRPPAASGIDDALSIAFLILLERLTPSERAVFLLREAFGYACEDVALILGHSKANCRQILRRAKQHIAKGRPRFAVSAEQRQKLLRQFAEAASRGDMQGLTSSLADDVELHTGGRGKTSAASNPVYDANRVARFMLRAPGKLVSARFGFGREVGDRNDSRNQEAILQDTYRNPCVAPPNGKMTNPRSRKLALPSEISPKSVTNRCSYRS